MEVSAEFTSTNSGIEATHPQYRQIAIVICISVLLVGIFDYFAGRPSTSPVNLDATIRLIIFGSALLLMCALELIRQHQRRSQTIYPIIYIVLVTLLSAIALSVSNPNYGQLLLLLPILFAELTFPRWVSVLIVFVAFLFLFLRRAFDESRTFLTVVDLQSLLIFTVLLLLTWMMARLIKNEWSNRLELQMLHDELKKTSTQLAQLAVLNERNRMARDIHDSVGHHLAAVSIQLDMAARLHQRDPHASVSAIQRAQAVTHDALHDVRLSVSTLRQSNDTFALVPAIELLIGRIANESLAINYRLDGDETLYPQPVQLVFYRAIQEGLTNIFKHASASHVSLWLQFLPQQARLRIIDDGVGFDTQKQTAGSGLHGVQERVEQLGGRVTIQGHTNEGTILDISLPKPML